MAAKKPGAQATVTLKHLAANIAESHEMSKKQTEAVLGIRGGQCRTDRDEIDRGCEQVQRRIREARQHRHRMGGEIGEGLDDHQNQRHRDGGNGGAAHQAAGLGKLVHGNSLSVRQGWPAWSRA